jgi:hypothetical protein
MNNLTQLYDLVRTHSIKQALIIDDAYDTVPFAEDLQLADDIHALGAELHRRVSPTVKKKLCKLLSEKGLDADDFASGLAEDEFVAAVWELSQTAKITKTISEKIFKVFEANQVAKREQLKYLEDLLQNSKIDFRSQGRRDDSASEGFQIVFLDLYLGVTDTQAALDDAVERIRLIVQDKSDENRPLIVVMSTVGSTRLYDLASDLQARAELLGCKFRAINKEDFPQALPKALTELLVHKDDAQAVAKWLDGWSSTIVAAAHVYRKDMRLLDLSDLAYLTRFRLDAESTTLGEYLNALSATYVQFCIEQEFAASRKDRLLDNVKFDKFPASHFLPSNQIPKLKHASSFLNEEVIKSNGHQFADAKSVLQLGDLIVEKPRNWKKTGKIAPEDMPVFVVISQACDIAHGNSDALLLLRGIIRKRDWTAALRNVPETTDVFLHGGEQYQIEWQKARIAAWSATLVDQRLAKNGDYLRIGRFRAVEALKLQQIFASNLTRVGTIAAPHPHTDVGVSFTAPTGDGSFTEIFKFTPVQRMAAVLWANPPAAKAYQLLVFNSEIAERVVSNIKGTDLSAVKEQFAQQIRSMTESPEMLSAFTTEIRVSKELDFGSGIKVEIRWLKNLVEAEKDVRKSKLVMALTTASESGGS